MSTRAEELVYLSAAQLAKRIRGRQLSSQELTEAYLARIDEVMPRGAAAGERYGELGMSLADA